jgi:hypothetical protein
VFRNRFVPDAGHVPSEDQLPAAQLMMVQGRSPGKLATCDSASASHPRNPWSIDALGRGLVLAVTCGGRNRSGAFIIVYVPTITPSTRSDIELFGTFSAGSVRQSEQHDATKSSQRQPGLAPKLRIVRLASRKAASTTF